MPTAGAKESRNSNATAVWTVSPKIIANTYANTEGLLV